MARAGPGTGGLRKAASELGGLGGGPTPPLQLLVGRGWGVASSGVAFLLLPRAMLSFLGSTLGLLSARLDRVWTESSQVTGKSPGQLAGMSPGQLAGKLPGQLAGKSPGQLAEKSPGQLAGKSPGQLAGKLAGKSPGQLPGRLAGKSPGQSPGKCRVHLEAGLPSSPPEHAVPCALIICLGWGSCPGTCCQACNS